MSKGTEEQYLLKSEKPGSYVLLTLTLDEGLRLQTEDKLPDTLKSHVWK